MDRVRAGECDNCYFTEITAVIATEQLLELKKDEDGADELVGLEIGPVIGSEAALLSDSCVGRVPA